MNPGSARTPSGIVGPTFGTAHPREPPSRSAVVSSFFAVHRRSVLRTRRRPVARPLA